MNDDADADDDAGADVTIRAAAPEEVIDLRLAVLRPGFPRETAMFTLDHDPGTHHFVAVARGDADGDRIVGCVTISRPRQFENHADAIQLRAMAVAEGVRGGGVGRKLLAHVDDHVRVLPPPRPLMWCNARVSAIGFYERCGWTVASDVFDSPPAGPHVKMTRQV
jgi:GNAT superfamily N-acetyltransferase